MASKVPDVASLGDLLPLQALDTRAMQLRHRRDNLELRTTKKEKETLLESRRTEMARIEERLRAVRRSQKEAEDHASLIEDRASLVETSMYDGSVTDPRELESLQAELAQLRTNQDDFETRALELMEQADPIETDLAEVRAGIGAVEEELGTIAEELAVAEAEIDAELDGVATERAATERSVDPAHLELYDSLRGRGRDVVVAKMEGRRCGGCHLEIPSAQAEAIRSASDPAEMACPECGCLLVG